MSAHYVVIGAGPVGWTIAERLAGQGKSVRLATRSGAGPDHPLVERVRADAQDRDAVHSLTRGSIAVFHCIHAAYSARAWEAELPRAEAVVLAAAEAAGAVVIFPESLYSYSRPDQVMREDSPRNASGGKRGVRTRLLQARAASAADTVSVVAGDFFGPRVRTAHAGERVVPKILAGKRVSVVGSTTEPHAFTYVPDLAEAMIRAAARPALCNRVWHAPTGPVLTQRQLAAAFADAAGNPLRGITGIPGWVLRLSGRFSAGMKEVSELAYQFEKPFVMDSTVSEAAFGLKPTPLPEAAAATVNWWRTDAAA